MLALLPATDHQSPAVLSRYLSSLRRPMMIDYDKITRKVAEDLCRRKSTQDEEEIERLVREAFRRGLQLGLSVRLPEALTRAPDARAVLPSSPLVH
jgi:hypothetical protein